MRDGICLFLKNSNKKGAKPPLKLQFTKRHQNNLILKLKLKRLKGSHHNSYYPQL